MPIQPADDSVTQPNPLFAEIEPLHRALEAPEYVTSSQVFSEVDADIVNQQLDGNTQSLRAEYLFKTLGIDPQPQRGTSWSRLFGNFMGTVAAFGILLDNIRFDERGYTSQNDAYGIISMVRALQEYRARIHPIAKAADKVSNTMRLSAEFCAAMVRDLHDIFLNTDYRIFVGPGGGPILRSEIGRENISSWIEGNYEGDVMVEGSQVLFTPEGVNAFKVWAQHTQNPTSFLRPVSAPPEARFGTGHPNVELDIFGTVEEFPRAHPRLTPAVSRVLVELVGAAEAHSVSLLQARWNGWRQSIDVRVPTTDVDRFLQAIGFDESMGTLRGEHGWWIERIGKQANIVIPTQPSIHIARFESLAINLWREVENVDAFISDVGAKSKLGLDTLNQLWHRLDQLETMQHHLFEKRKTNPSARTQESYAVYELIARLLHVMRPYSLLRSNLNQDEVVRLYCQKCLDSNVFSLLEHIPATAQRWSIPRTRVELPDTRPSIIPVEWIASHQLMTRLFELTVAVAGSFDEDSAHPVNVSTFYTWDEKRSSVVITNRDGRMVSYFNQIDPNGDHHLIPSLAREIFDLSRKAAPRGMMLSVDPNKNQIHVPIRVARHRGNSGLMAKYPGLFRARTPTV